MDNKMLFGAIGLGIIYFLTRKAKAGISCYPNEWMGQGRCCT